MDIPVRRWSEIPAQDRNKLFSRSEIDIESVKDTVQEIIDNIRTRGDEALELYLHQFDGVDLAGRSLRVAPEEFDRAEESLSLEVKEALRWSIDNVRRFHETQVPHEMSMMEVRPGLWAGERATPIDSVGLYVPRGRGSFPSMVYMLAIPALLAKVPRVVMVSPPLADGTFDPACLYAAKLCGVHEVYRAGGAQAVAALAYGTQSIDPVAKIIGPGSMYVTAAKRLLYSVVDVGLPAGPSESLVLADDSADPWKVSLDLMVEAEHGSDSAALLITDSNALALQVARYVGELVEKVEEPRRTFLQDVFRNYGGIIVTDGMDEALDLVNRFATEHLSVQVRDPWALLGRIRNAGEILLGENLPFSGANYSCGPNAVLPTGGKARTYSAVSVRDFIKYSSVVYATQEGYEALSGPVTTLADYEGFETHAEAFRKREQH